MASVVIRPEERAGLAVAVVLHVALVAMLLLQPEPAQQLKTPERMTVSLVEDVGLTSTGPVVTQKTQAAVAPTISEDIAPPAPPEPTPAPQPEPREVPKPAPPKPTPPKPSPKPAAKPVTKPAPAKPQPSKPKPAPAPAKPAAKPAPAKPAPTKPAAAKPGGGSKLGDDFLKGANFGDAKADAAVPASQIGAQARASLNQAISRQLKPHWSSPQGADAELLVTVLAFDLNRDGTLAGAPRVVSQSGVTDANRTQAGRHKELAIRAVQLAAPFDLPPEYYNAWKRVTAFRFDRKM